MKYGSVPHAITARVIYLSPSRQGGKKFYSSSACSYYSWLVRFFRWRKMQNRRVSHEIWLLSLSIVHYNSMTGPDWGNVLQGPAIHILTFTQGQHHNWTLPKIVVNREIYTTLYFAKFSCNTLIA